MIDDLSKALKEVEAIKNKVLVLQTQKVEMEKQLEDLGEGVSLQELEVKIKNDHELLVKVINKIKDKFKTLLEVK